MNIFDLENRQIRRYENDKLEYAFKAFPVLKNSLTVVTDPQILAEAGVDFVFPKDQAELWDKLFFNGLLAISRAYLMNSSAGLALGFKQVEVKGNPLFEIKLVDTLEELDVELNDLHKRFDEIQPVKMAEALNNSNKDNELVDGDSFYQDATSADSDVLAIEEKYISFFLKDSGGYLDVACRGGEVESRFINQWVGVSEFSLKNNEDKAIEAEYTFESFAQFCNWFNNIRVMFEIYLVQISIEKLVDADATKETWLLKEKLDKQLEEIADSEIASADVIRKRILGHLYSVLNEVKGLHEGEAGYLKFHAVESSYDLHFNFDSKRYSVNLYHSFDLSSEPENLMDDVDY